MAQATSGSGSIGPVHGLSRRELLRGAGLALAGGAAAAAGLHRLGGLGVSTGSLREAAAEALPAAPLAPLPASVTEPVLVRSAFQPYVGERFRLRSASAGVSALVLFKVRSLRTERPAAADGQQSFSLLFRGPVGRPLEQGVYELEHRRLGDLALLLVPMRPEPDARYYEAIVNRTPPR